MLSVETVVRRLAEKTALLCHNLVDTRRTASIEHDLLFRSNTFNEHASNPWREAFLTIRTSLFRDFVVQLMALVDDQNSDSNSVRKVVEKLKRPDVSDALRDSFAAVGVFPPSDDDEEWVKLHLAAENRKREAERRS